MSKWDWIHAGLEIATYAQVQKAQQHLGEMKTDAQIEVARRAFYEAIKSFIFDISRNIQLVEEQVEAFPQQVYIVSKSLECRLDNSGLSADMLPDTQDKEYFFKTERKVAEVIRKSKEKLSPEQIQVSEQAAEYIVEMPTLQRAIVAKTAQESLNETDKNWQELSSKNGNNQLLILLGAFGIMLSCILLMTPIMGGGSYTGLLMLIGFATFIGSISLIIKGRDSDPRYTNLKSKRGALLKQLIPEDEWTQITSFFGDLSSEQFKKIYNERLAFLSSLLGSDFQKYSGSNKYDLPNETEISYAEQTRATPASTNTNLALDKLDVYIAALPEVSDERINELLQGLQDPMAYKREAALNEARLAKIADPRIIGAIEILATSDRVDSIRGIAKRTLSILKQGSSI